MRNSDQPDELQAVNSLRSDHFGKSSPTGASTGDGQIVPSKNILGRGLRGSVDIRTLVAEMLEEVCDTYSADMLALLLYDDKTLQQAYTIGIAPDQIKELEKQSNTEPASSYLYSLRSPVAGQVNTDGTTPLHAAWASITRTQQVVLAPIGGERPCGMLVLCHNHERLYTPDDILYLHFAANMLMSVFSACRTVDDTIEHGSRDRFISALSHELRTPLTSIIGFTQIIRKRLNSSPNTDRRLIDQVDVLWSQAHRLSRLIDTFVDVSHVESGEFTINMGKVELRSLLKGAIDQAVAQARSRHRVNFEEPGHNIFVHGDAKRLDQVFTQVLSNAIRFSPEDKPIVVRCEEHLDEGKCVTSIEDRGPGIPASRIKEIFDRFSEHGPLRSGGLGVGLFFSKTIVEAHGGSINLDSRIGKGTTMYVTLPL